MRRILCALALLGLASPSPARADGLLVPTDRSLPPLSLTHQRVRVAIDGQVATTSVEQVYRNATGRDLEADYLFPLPAGATVREFAMWVDGKRLTGETIDAAKARKTYEDIVRRLKDPGLLEFVDRDLWKVRIFPVPRHGEQKIEIKFTTLLPREGDLVSYRYPLRTGQAPKQTTRDFTLIVDLKSPDAIGPIYSPTHDVAIDRRGDHRASVSFESSRYTLDRDFQLYYAPRSRDVGLSLLTRRASHEDRGYFLLLLSPRAGGEEKAAPRDLVVVLDTSHSMSGEKMKQAKGALRSALDSLKPDDRFALIQFATVVTPFREGLLKAESRNLADARAWVEKLEAQGATDIGSALEEALKLRPRDGVGAGRSFQVVFFTDGLPTAGLSSAAILKAAKDRAGEGARIFAFGVGDDVDAHLLDQLAEATRAASTYVRPSEDLEAKASALVAKISHPVRTDLRLRAGGDVRLLEMYPPRLPDLFRGEQLQVAGRYEGEGHVALTLESRVGDRSMTDTYEVHFPEVATENDFVAPIWARRKVGYLLDQIRLHGEKGELKDEVTRLGREFGIATPYTSYLIVPDERPRLARDAGTAPADRRLSELQGRGNDLANLGARGADSQAGQQAKRSAIPEQESLGDRSTRARTLARSAPGSSGTDAFRRSEITDGASRTPAATQPPAETDSEMRGFGGGMGGSGGYGRTMESQYGMFNPGMMKGAPASGKEAIELAQRLAGLKAAGRVNEAPVVKEVGGRRFRMVEDAWVDDRFDPSAGRLTVLAFGAAYFRLLERHPELKDIFALGSRVVWVSPSGTVLILDATGKDEVADAELDRLFAKR